MNDEPEIHKGAGLMAWTVIAFMVLGFVLSIVLWFVVNVPSQAEAMEETAGLSNAKCTCCPECKCGCQQAKGLRRGVKRS